MLGYIDIQLASFIIQSILFHDLVTCSLLWSEVLSVSRALGINVFIGIRRRRSPALPGRLGRSSRWRDERSGMSMSCDWGVHGEQASGVAGLGALTKLQNPRVPLCWLQPNLLPGSCFSGRRDGYQLSYAHLPAELRHSLSLRPYTPPPPGRAVPGNVISGCSRLGPSRPWSLGSRGDTL